MDYRNARLQLEAQFLIKKPADFFYFLPFFSCNYIGFADNCKYETYGIKSVKSTNYGQDMSLCKEGSAP